jgi:hypothetical protein
LKQEGEADKRGQIKVHIRWLHRRKRQEENDSCSTRKPQMEGFSCMFSIRKLINFHFTSQSCRIDQRSANQIKHGLLPLNYTNLVDGLIIQQPVEKMVALVPKKWQIRLIDGWMDQPKIYRGLLGMAIVLQIIIIIIMHIKNPSLTGGLHACS